MMTLYSCHPETIVAIQRWLVDSLRTSREAKRSRHDVCRESTPSVKVAIAAAAVVASVAVPAATSSQPLAA